VYFTCCGDREPGCHVSFITEYVFMPQSGMELLQDAPSLAEPTMGTKGMTSRRRKIF
jgi:hypothetical protein